MRLTFFISTAISMVLPFGGLYGLAAWYIYDSFAVPYDENNNPYSETLDYIDWYIYVKMFLFVAYTCINTFFASEMIWPIYDWWHKLAQLQDTVPYERPSAEEIEDSDTIGGADRNRDSLAEDEEFTFHQDVFDF